MSPANLYMVSVTQDDGTSHDLELTYEQLLNLGIKIESNLETNSVSQLFKNVHNDKVISKEKPLGSCENPIEIIRDGATFHSTQNLSADYLKQITDALTGGSNIAVANSGNIVYRVVYPEELNLKPLTTKSTNKRGRKRKSLAKTEDEENDDDTDKLPITSFKTRSGRLIKLPRRVQQAFNMNITNSETTQEQTVQKKQSIENQFEIPPPPPPLVKEKRHISGQYLCPTCKKKYLGRWKIMKHLEQFPDHGPIPGYREHEDCETWNYLQKLVKETPVGKQGAKFCQELFGFIKAMRKLAPFLFKTVGIAERHTFYVDESFSQVLGLKMGKYYLNDAEMVKILDVFSYLNIEQFDDTYLDKKNTGKTSTVDESNTLQTNANSSCTLNKSTKETLADENRSEENLTYTVHASSKDSADKLNDDSFAEPEKLEVKREKPNLCELLAESQSMNQSRSPVDDLILPNVVAGQVCTLLDNSASSDELNVDQFVNERFKNLTETDMELANSSLNLDLPALDLFHFHSS